MEGLAALLPFAFIGGFILLVVGLIAYSFYAESQRKKAIEELAGKMGLSFSPEGEHSLLQLLEGFHLFSVGRSRRIFNMIHGETEDVHLAIFDYRYTTGSGKNKSTHSQTVIYIASPLLVLPEFTLCPENLFHKIGQMFGYGDIDFDTHPKFSGQFLLRGPNEEAIRETFHKELLDHLEGQPGITIEGRGNHLIFFRARTRSNPDQIEHLMSEGFGVYSMLKSKQ